MEIGNDNIYLTINNEVIELFTEQVNSKAFNFVFQNYLLSNFNNKEASDITLQIKDIRSEEIKETFYLNKFVLNRIKYFRNLLKFHENRQIIELILYDEINGFNSELFTIFFKFLYIIDFDIDLLISFENISILNLHFLFDFIGFESGCRFIEINQILTQLNLDNVFVVLEYYLKLNDWLLENNENRKRNKFLNNRIYIYCKQWIITFFNLFSKEIKNKIKYNYILHDLKSHSEHYNILKYCSNKNIENLTFLLDSIYINNNIGCFLLKTIEINDFMKLNLQIRIDYEEFIFNIFFKVNSHKKSLTNISFDYNCKIWNTKEIMIERESNTTVFSNELINILKIKKNFFNSSFNDINLNYIKNNMIFTNNHDRNCIDVIPLKINFSNITIKSVDIYESY